MSKDLEMNLSTFSLKELENVRKQFQAMINNVDHYIACHPDTINGILSDHSWKDHKEIRAIINSVSFITEDSGWTDSRKNPIEYHGYCFKFSGSNEEFYFRSGSNWCSEVRDVGNSSRKYFELDRNFLMNNCDEVNGELLKECLDTIALKPNYVVVGYLLLYLEGW